VSYSSFAGQLSTQTVGAVNPAANLGSITFRWTDLDGDGFAQANEVNTSQILSTSGINLTDRSAVTSLSRIDPNLAPPRTRTIVAGVDRELMSNLVVQAAYTYSRTSDLFGNAVNNITPRLGVPLATGYGAGPTLTGTLPDGTPYSVATFIPAQSLVAAGGGGFLTTTIPGYYTDYHGVEFGLTKRMSK